MPDKNKEENSLPAELVKLTTSVSEDCLGDEDKIVYRTMFSSLRKEYGIVKPGDVMLLDLACMEYVRIKRFQKFIKEHGDAELIITKKGNKFVWMNSVLMYLNNSQITFRQHMKELMLTPKENIKKNVHDIKPVDFSDFLSDNTVDAEELEDGTDKKVDSKGRKNSPAKDKK